MKTIKLEIAYDGTDYCGWQVQPNGPSIEAEIKKALKLCKISYTDFTSSGRTDSGVHAKAHTASFKTSSGIKAERIKYALNTKLREDIRVIKSSEEPISFDAHRSAKGKHYSYNIDTSEIADPLKKRYFWHFPYQIDESLLAQACTKLAGKHDYRAFMASGSSVKTTEREVFTIKPEWNGDSLTIHFIGNGFLYNMVRILTGTIMETASGKISLGELDNVFINPKRENAGITAPAKGLTLEKVYYSEPEMQKDIEKLSISG